MKNYPTTIRNQLAQIELKNYLFYIYRRKIEYESFKRHIEQYTYDNKNGKHITNEFFVETGDQAFVILHSMEMAKLDIEFFIKQATSVISYLKESTFSSIKYEILYFEIADYIVTLANYDLQDVHIAILPLKDKSIILMFTDVENIHYKSFIEQFKELKRNDKLSVINYLIFLYTEDYFINESIDKKVKDSLKMAANVHFKFDLGGSYEQLISNYTLTKRTNIPNLLHKKHRLKPI